jgi:hypothetical protein
MLTRLELGREGRARGKSHEKKKGRKPVLTAESVGV